MPLTQQERENIKTQIINSWGVPDGTWTGIPITGGFRMSGSKKPLLWFMSLPEIYKRRIIQNVFYHMGRVVSFNNRNHFVYFLPFHGGAGWGRKAPLLSTQAAKEMWGGNNVENYLLDHMVFKRWIDEYANDGSNALEACQVVYSTFSSDGAVRWFYGDYFILDVQPPMLLHLGDGLQNYQKSYGYSGTTDDHLHDFLKQVLPDIFCDVVDSLEPQATETEKEVSAVPHAVILSIGKYEEGSKSVVMIKRTGNLNNLLDALQQKISQKGKSIVFQALYSASSKTPLRERIYGAVINGERQYDLATYRWLSIQESERPVYVYNLINWLSYSQAMSILNAL